MSLNRITILYGPDTWTRREKLREIKQQLEPSALTNGNIVELDGRQIKLSELRNTCSALPFFGNRRLVIVHDLLKRFESLRSNPLQPSRKQKGTGELDEWRQLSDYVQEMPTTTLLVLVDEDIKPDNPMLKLLTPVAEIHAFPLPKPDRVKSWVINRVKAAKGSISPDAVDLMESLVGHDLWAMSNEIDKLVSFCAGRSITVADVREMVSHSREENIFALAEAILDGRGSEAQHSFARILREGVEPLAVLAMVARQLRLTISAKLTGTNTPTVELAEKLKLQLWQARKIADMARRSTLDRLLLTYRKLLETDLAIKSNRYHPSDLAIICLIGELDTGRGSTSAQA